MSITRGGIICDDDMNATVIPLGLPTVSLNDSKSAVSGQTSLARHSGDYVFRRSLQNISTQQRQQHVELGGRSHATASSRSVFTQH
jgi:hypothetical protein